ncbi:hypothetical protein [Marivirga sp.]|uniref:hypothetical protein n=1 Tax=Marivirga sp. TaxID=2018662 RepID=UPI002600EDC4|nr:hypothetical protein [Marivirga sp.]
MTLSAEQIAQIKSWISKRGFTHTDVQYEIIDHVASAIEEKMKNKPELSLEEAFSEVHKSFGVFGFQTFEESIANRLNKELWRSYGIAIKQIIKSEKILIPILLILSLILFRQKFIQYFQEFHQNVFLTSLVGSIVYYFVLYRRKKHIKNYLSFRMAIGIIPSLLYVIGNLSINFLRHTNLNFAIAVYSIAIIGIYGVFLGTNQMINKTERLHNLYQSN